MEEQPKRKRGRKKHIPPLVRRHLRVTDEQIKLLRMWGRGDASVGLRWLIEQAKHVVRRPDTDEVYIQGTDAKL